MAIAFKKSSHPPFQSREGVQRRGFSKSFVGENCDVSIPGSMFSLPWDSFGRRGRLATDKPDSAESHVAATLGRCRGRGCAITVGEVGCGVLLGPTCKPVSIRMGTCISCGFRAEVSGWSNEKPETFETLDLDLSRFSIVADTNVARALCNLRVGPYVCPISSKISRGTCISFSISCLVVPPFSQRL